MSLQSAGEEISARLCGCGGVCVCVSERRKLREPDRQRREQMHGGRASIVADMIACLDLSHGKNKTSISHYLRFNQIPTFFASLPQNCHELKISPFLIKEPRVQLISRLGLNSYRETLRHKHTYTYTLLKKKRGENTCTDSPNRNPAFLPPHQANYF